MASFCPACGSSNLSTRRTQKSHCGAVGSLAGAAVGSSGLLAGSETGAALGVVGGPAGMLIGGLAGAVIGGLLANAVGCSSGDALVGSPSSGGRYHCVDCGHVFNG